MFTRKQAEKLKRKLASSPPADWSAATRKQAKKLQRELVAAGLIRIDQNGFVHCGGCDTPLRMPLLFNDPDHPVNCPLKNLDQRRPAELSSC